MSFIFLTGCFRNFYNTNTKTLIDADTISKLASENKYFIIHFRNATNGLENIYIHNSSLSGKIVQLSLEHSDYLTPIANNHKMVVKAKDKRYVSSEVHLYINDTLPTNDSVFNEKLSSLYRMDIYTPNKAATTKNDIISAFGIVLGLAAIAAIVGAALLSE